MIDDLPSPFLVEWLPRIVARIGPRARALDLAMGRGRHARALAQAGLRTYGVDIKLDAVRGAVARARADDLVINGWCADLTVSELPRAAFDVIVVARFLQRNLFRSIRDSLRDGGVVMYETFTVNQRRHGTGPTSPDHLLQPNELAHYFEGFNVLFQEEVTEPLAMARIVAQQMSGRRGRPLG